jgi:hypothetical protein
LHLPFLPRTWPARAAAGLLLIAGAYALIKLSGGPGREDPREVFTRWQDLVARGGTPDQASEEAMAALVPDRGLLTFMREHPVRRETAETLLQPLRRRGTGARPEGLIAPDATITETRPSFRFRLPDVSAEDYEFRLRLVVESTGASVEHSLEGVRPGLDGLSSFELPPDVRLEVRPDAPVHYQWNVVTVPRRPTVPSVPQSEETLSFAVVTSGFRSALLSTLVRTGDPAVDKIVSAYALLRHRLPGDALEILSGVDADSPPAILKHRDFLKLWAHAQRGEESPAEALHRTLFP